LSSAQANAITSTQIAAMSTAQGLALFNASKGLSPLVLDLNGDGISTLNASAGVSFDLAATGTKVNAGWIGGGDGLLVQDVNGDGVINDGSELFGVGTTLANGSKATNGYEALGQLDSNGDGVIDAKDSSFSSLQVWVDGNADGISQADELKSLASLNITKLNLDVKLDGSTNNGNTVGLTSTYETADGASHAAADVWFATGSTSANLSGSVSSLSAALSNFAATASAATTNATKLELPNATSSTVAAMADAISHYDNKLTAVSTSVATEDALRLKALQGNHSQGFLAAK
jgi:hypothetical protein